MKYLFQFRRYRLPFRAVVRTAHRPWAEREGVIVRLEAENGGVGFGEASAIPWFGTESVDEVESACRALGGVINEERMASVPARLVCLRNALGAAHSDWELASRNAGSGETGLSENVASREPAYLGVAALLPAGKAAIEKIAPAAEIGFRVFKWKVGVGDLADELGLLDDLCAELPSGAALRLDANGAWDRRQASRWLERCAERPVEFVEQPIAAEAKGAADLLLGLAGDFPTKLALDESVVNGGDVEKWLGLGWPGIFVAKTALFTDPTHTLERLAAARADVVFSSALETAVGARNALRLAFAWHERVEKKIPPRALGFGVWPLFADGRFDGPRAMPFFSRDDVERLHPEAVWNALN